MIVQIYEIQTPAEAESLVALGVDRIGSVILSAAGWKDPVIRETVRVVQSAGAASSLIPLFNTPDAVLEAADYYRPDVLHFCETLSGPNGILDICGKLINLQKKVRDTFPQMAVMRSVPIAPPGMASRVPTLELARLFEPVSDYFLTDTLLIRGDDAAAHTSPQPVEGFIGITGRTCDWQMARQLVVASRIPVILAGGIGPENVLDGLKEVRPAGVDSCTGTNVRDKSGRPTRFKKDLQRVRRLVDLVRSMQDRI